MVARYFPGRKMQKHMCHTLITLLFYKKKPRVRGSCSPFFRISKFETQQFFKLFKIDKLQIQKSQVQISDLEFSLETHFPPTIPPPTYPSIHPPPLVEGRSLNKSCLSKMDIVTHRDLDLTRKFPKKDSEVFII